MDNWDEIRTAYEVARAGTVSGAAEVLGVHHATVIRHIDALEARMKVKLFQRHARGYTATEAGQDLLQVATATDDQFTQLAGRLRGRGEGVSGDLVVTSLAVLSPMLAPTLARFRKAHPDVKIRYLTGDRVFRLEYGEAHVAIRAGRAPEELDNVVQPFIPQSMHLVASPAYIADYGCPKDEVDLVNHWFIGSDDPESRAPFNKWLSSTLPAERIAYRVTDSRGIMDAVLAGAGIGFVSKWEMERHPELVEVIPPKPVWSGELWLVTHVDLHRSTKVQTFLKFLKGEMAR